MQAKYKISLRQVIFAPVIWRQGSYKYYKTDINNKCSKTMKYIQKFSFHINKQQRSKILERL